MKADETLDCVGLYCPMPIVKTAAKILKMENGQVLEILADDQGIKQDMPAWCKATGHEFLETDDTGGEIKVYVRKKHD